METSSNEFGRIVLTHSQEDRPSGEIKAQNGAYKSQELFRNKIIMLHTQIKALVEGYDFIINDIGEIKMLR
jgi:CRISPR-associated endonuclease Csn1